MLDLRAARGDVLPQPVQHGELGACRGGQTRFERNRDRAEQGVVQSHTGEYDDGDDDDDDDDDTDENDDNIDDDDDKW